MTARNSSGTKPDERELVIARVFDAPRDLVFKAWTDIEHGKHWSGPRGFTATHIEGDLRPGGSWRLCLRRDETGEEMWQGGVYRAVVSPEKLEFTFAWQDGKGQRGHETLVTVTFAEQGGKTKMVFRQGAFENLQSRDGHQGGWTSAFDRLEEFATHIALNPAGGEAARREIVLTRVFDAPRDLVFKAWTDGKRLAQWWGPKGFTNPVCEVDARPGGEIRIVMRAPDGSEYPMRGTFRDIAPPERLVFTNIAIDKDGNDLIDGLTTVTFAERGGKTELILRTSGVALFAHAVPYLKGMEQGWSQSLDKLAALVAAR